MHYSCPICNAKIESALAPVTHTCVFNPETIKLRGIYDSVETAQGVDDIVQIKIKRRYEKPNDEKNGHSYGMLTITIQDCTKEEIEAYKKQVEEDNKKNR